MLLIYSIGIFLMNLCICIASFFNNKIKQLFVGRKDWYSKLKSQIDPTSSYVWIHCASLGEFEQGRPLIETIKKRDPSLKILVSFFSPSGYEIRKNYPLADIVCYLPSDTHSNARRFVELVKPKFVIWVKYEYWYNFLNNISRNNIPLYLVSGIFRKQQVFFKWYGAFFRKMLKMFTTLFVQDELSKNMLESIAISNAIVAGDTRCDRVAEIAATSTEIPQIAEFADNEKLFICGSSWSGDEDIIVRYINKYPEKMKWIFAPHKIDEANIERLSRMFEVSVVRFTQYSAEDKQCRVMIIDNMGMLASAYSYGYIAAVGGGFHKEGIHNTLEPACRNIPVLFGPNYTRFREAVDLIEEGGAVSYSNYTEFETILNSWLANNEAYNVAALAAGNYVNRNCGATNTILQHIKM